MKPAICFFFLFCFALSAKTQNCNCPENLSALRQLIQDNYAGYADKIKPTTRAGYTQLYNRLRKRADTAAQQSSCVAVLQAYIDFWKDGHLGFSGGTTDATPAAPKWYKPDAAKAEAYLKNNTSRLHPLEGIWTLDDGLYTLALVRNAGKQNSFTGVVLRSKNEAWKPGMVKMTLQKAAGAYYDVQYTTSSFYEDPTIALLNNNLLDVSGYGVFQKLEPATATAIALASYQSPFPQTQIDFRFPNDSTAILTLGSFGVHNKVIVDSLLAVHKTALEQRPNWIIDVRNNGGGGTGTYENLIPYLYTNPVIRSGSHYWLSPQNVEAYAVLASGELPQDIKDHFSVLVATGRAKPNTWAPLPGDTFRFAAPTPNPKKIAVLANRGTGSSAEIFLMDARQSKKVTVFGTYTGGVVDYGDGNEFNLPCTGMKVMIPVRRSNYLDQRRYDGIGIKPDVPVPAAVRDWYQFVQRHWAAKRRA